MHFHPTPASASGDALSGYHSAETAIALRRAKELRDAASKLKVSSLDILDIGPEIATDPKTVSMVAAWAGGGAASGHLAKDSPPPPQASNSETQQEPPPIQPVRSVQSVQSVQRMPSSMPVSFWA